VDHRVFAEGGGRVGRVTELLGDDERVVMVARERHEGRRSFQHADRSTVMTS
jgi:hypothetical protein